MGGVGGNGGEGARPFDTSSPSSPPLPVALSPEERDLDAEEDPHGGKGGHHNQRRQNPYGDGQREAAAKLEPITYCKTDQIVSHVLAVNSPDS